LPAAGDAVEQIDRDLRGKIDALPAQLSQAYEGMELQQCALLPVELARAANGFVDATAPFKLAKDPAQSARLDAVLNVAAHASKTALAALLPILPEKAAAGLHQLGIDVSGRVLTELLTSELPAGHRVGTGSPLFAKVEQK
jgi:methionyl-tRNA synthetase